MSNYTLEKWQTLPKNIQTFIVQASVKDGSDRWQNFPIGMSFSYIQNDIFKNPAMYFGSHTDTVLCAFSTHTDQRRRGTANINRQTIEQTLAINGIQNRFLDSSEFYVTMPSYKFVISPEGNGIDCHRHYEALIAGCIPIVESNPLIESKYKGLPILYTKDYREITHEYLNDVYNKMLVTEYDFSKLFLSAYDANTQAIIKDCGNYWTKRHTGLIWYTW
jgi:hypothetical protein